jgi:hypothetical protein
MVRNQTEWAVLFAKVQALWVIDAHREGTSPLPHAWADKRHWSGFVRPELLLGHQQHRDDAAAHLVEKLMLEERGLDTVNFVLGAGSASEDLARAIAQRINKVRGRMSCRSSVARLRVRDDEESMEIDRNDSNPTPREQVLIVDAFLKDNHAVQLAHEAVLRRRGVHTLPYVCTLFNGTMKSLPPGSPLSESWETDREVESNGVGFQVLSLVEMPLRRQLPGACDLCREVHSTAIPLNEEKKLEYRNNWHMLQSSVLSRAVA